MTNEEAQQMLEENGVDCPMCELSTDHMVLGILGYLLHVKCTACGWEFNIRLERRAKVPA